MIYLATPYTHPDRLIREVRAERAIRIAANYVAMGEHVFSPIAYGHTLYETGVFADFTAAGWEAFNTNMLIRATELRIVRMPGYDQSDGIAKEIALALQINLPISYVDPIA